MHNTLQPVLVLLAAAVLVVVVFRTLRLPPLLGYLIVGVAIGPNALGWITTTDEVQSLAEIGVVFLMFSIGLEFSLTRLMTMRRIVFGLGAAQVLATLALVVGVSVAVGVSWRDGIVLGGALAMSSTAILAKLLAERFDKIFFTGSPAVGRIVYQAAAKHLTPVTLELGGKSPAIISQSADLPTAIKRLVWAKFLNAGQTCIAPDYVFIHESIYQECLILLQQEIEKNQYALGNKNYVQIINERNLARLEQLIQKEKVSYGGKVNRNTRTIEPTLLRDISLEDPIMQEEIFGPILPLLPYTKFEDALSYIQDHEKPLSAYLFSNDKAEQAAWLGQLSFGGGCINDAIMHITNPNLPFGGVGQSGTGSYHGKAGFETFSHRKSLFEKPRLFEVPLKYPPYTTTKMGWIKRLLQFS